MPLSRLRYIYWLIHFKVLAHIITCPKLTIEILNVFNKDTRTTRKASLPRQFWNCSALPSIARTDVFKKASSWWVINPSTKWFHDIETRPLICSVNQLNAFYMVQIFIDDWLKAKKNKKKQDLLIFESYKISGAVGPLFTISTVSIIVFAPSDFHKSHALLCTCFDNTNVG